MSDKFKRTKALMVDPNIRNKNFNEVSEGYDEDGAVLEANRCLNCKNKPCVKGCPVRIDIPAFIEKIKEKDYYSAYKGNS